MNRRIWLLVSAAFLALIAAGGLLGLVQSASASLPGAFSPQAAGTGKQSQYSDDFDSLKPAGLKGLSFSTLVNSGKVHVNTPSRPAVPWTSPFAPLLNIVWGNDMLTGSGAGEPGVGINQTNPLDALVSGNTSIDHTTDGGLTWASLASPPNPHGYGDVVNGWLADNPDHALEIALNPSGDGADMTCAQSTDFGVTWASATCTNLDTTYFDDREYIWVDNFASSPFHGRVYVTEALFDPAGSGSFNTVTIRRSSDNGATWNPSASSPIALVPNNEFALGQNHNEYPSLGISPNGTIGYVWHRGMCCGGPSPINSPNKVMFTRSTDGGVSFPYSTTIVTVPLNESVPFNSTSPFGQRWSDTPNIAADPTTNGTFYAVWTAYRTPSTPASAAVYLSSSTDNGATWSAPVIPYNNPNASIFQGFGWVKVTADHTVHVTYFGGTTSNTVAAQFYVQSTDGGVTWSAPFQLSSGTITTFASTTDYIADDVTVAGGTGAIISGIEENNGHHARMGTFNAVVGTPTPTVTGTPPTNTPTLTRTNTPTATPTVCGASAPYAYATATGTIVAGTTDTGNHCDDCLTSITLPFSYSLYDQTFTSAQVSSNGQLDFGTGDSAFSNTCLPDTVATYAIFPHWDDLNTSTGLSGCTNYPSGCGVFTSVSGTAPNRILNIDWHAVYYSNNAQLAHFEVRLYEGQKHFDLIYGQVDQTGTSATVGVERNNGDSNYTQFECNTGGLTNGLMLTFTQPPCSTSTPAPTNTSTPTHTPVPTNTQTATNTPVPTNTAAATNTPLNTPTSTSTPVPPTPTACTIQFSDVPVGSTFYPYIHCLVCLGIVNGYPDGTFHPNANVTRGQLSKIVSNSAGFSDTPTGQQFQDVPVGSPFYVYIFRLSTRGFISGYACGGPGEPCVPPANLPYFRPNANATRGQISKIVSNAAGFSDTPTGQQFQDVPVGSTFYDFIYRLVHRSIISGYACGGPGEPCVPPANLPYFRPNANATRGQMSKIDGLAFFPNCNIPSGANR
jgi:hypothetical protein